RPFTTQRQPPSWWQWGVPGKKKNPAQNGEKPLTYPPVLAFRERPAPAPPPMAMRPAAEPRTRLLIVFMLNLQVALKGRFRIRWVRHPRLVPLSLIHRLVASRLRTHPLNARDLSDPVEPSAEVQKIDKLLIANAVW